jgi:hypothetical protein
LRSATGKPRFPRNKKGTTAVLIVDTDLRFTFWLGQALDAAGYEAVPAISAHAASELIAEHGLTATLLIIDPALPGALPFLGRLRQTQPCLRAVATILPGVPTTLDLTKFDVVKAKPERLTQDELFGWIVLAQSLIRPRGASESAF